MARFNTVQSTISVTGATTFTYVINGATLLLTGTTGYTVTLANPASFSGTIQHVYNATGGNITLSAPVGRTIIGNGFTSAQTQIIPNGATYSITSNGTAYVISNNEGGPVLATTGTFSSTLTANGQLTATSTVSLSPSNASVTASPTGTGTVTINPGTAGTINNVAIGGTTRGAGNFTTLDANAAVGLSPSNAAVTISPTGTGTVNMSPGTLGNINNTAIGGITRAAGAFTTLTSNAATTFTAGTTSTAPGNGAVVVTGGVGISENLHVGGLLDAASIQDTPIGSVTRNTGAFTTLAANNGLSVTGGAVSTDAGVTSTFNGPIIVPNPTIDTHAANRNYVLNRIIWSTAAGLGTVTTNSSGVYSFTVTASSVSGAAITYTLQAGSLPTGGSLNSGNGVISGTTPNIGSFGFSFTIRATVGSLFEDRAFSMTLNRPPPTGQALYEGSYNTAGGASSGNDFTWVAPSGVNTVSVAVIGGGGGGCFAWAVCGGAGGGLAWANGIPVTPGSPYAVKAGHGGCWNGSRGGCSCFAGVMTACGGGCGCCGGSYNHGGATGSCCGSCGMVAYPGTASGGGGGGGYANNLNTSWPSGGVGCHGGGGSATEHHSSTHGTGGGGGTGIRGQGNNGACGSPSPGGHGTSGGGGQFGSNGTCGGQGEPFSNGNGNGFACGGSYGGGGGGGGTNQGGGWGGRGAVRIIWGPGRAYPSTGTADQ